MTALGTIAQLTVVSDEHRVGENSAHRKARAMF